MCLNDALNQRQADADTLARGIEFIKQAEDLVVITRINTDAVVTHVEDRLAIILPCANLNLWVRLIAHKLAGIVDQVLYYFDQSRPVTGDGGQIGHNDHIHVVRLDEMVFQYDGLAGYALKRYHFRWVCDPADT